MALGHLATECESLCPGEDFENIVRMDGKKDDIQYPKTYRIFCDEKFRTFSYFF